MIVAETCIKRERKHLRKLHHTITYLFAGIGLMFVAVFFAVKFKLTNVAGAVDSLNDNFQVNAQTVRVLGSQTTVVDPTINNKELLAIDGEITALENKKTLLKNYLCSLDYFASIAPQNVRQIISVKQKTKSLSVGNQMVFVLKNHLSDTTQYDSEVHNCINNFAQTNLSESSILEKLDTFNTKNFLIWPDKEEWQIITQSVAKDKEVIFKAAEVAGIEPRLIVSDLVVEQLRLYNSQRELYKKFFEPLKILANANKFSLGVMSIKEETAHQIENHLKDSSSPYYLGDEYAHLLDYQAGIDVGAERYRRLTAPDHYYNYLYGALYLKQFINQWQKAGYDLLQRPEILGTLFNVGFPQSEPNPNPSVGGSNISIGGTNYSFGRLSHEFYYSGEMADLFPYTINL